MVEAYVGNSPFVEWSVDWKHLQLGVSIQVTDFATFRLQNCFVRIQVFWFIRIKYDFILMSMTYVLTTAV